MDTQGYEDRVLNGPEGILDRIVGIQLELSLIPLYEEQCLYDEMIVRLQNKGFDLWSIIPVFINPKSGRLFQVDATFFRH